MLAPSQQVMIVSPTLKPPHADIYRAMQMIEAEVQQAATGHHLMMHAIEYAAIVHHALVFILILTVFITEYHNSLHPQKSWDDV